MIQLQAVRLFLLKKHLEVNKYKCPILAKPSGITYAEHQVNVMAEGDAYIENHCFVCRKYQNRVKKDLKRRITLVCEAHDEGKVHPRWQIPCQKDYQEFVVWESVNHKGYKEYETLMKGKAGQHIRNARVRHELISLHETKERNFPLSIICAISAHHSKLSFKYEDIWKDEAFDFWKGLRITDNLKRKDKLLKDVAHAQYEYAGLRSILQLADHRASTKEEGDFVPDYRPFEYEFKYNNRKAIQQIAEKYWEKDLLLLRAPTGAGKTDAALLWAAKQIENGRADRLVIAMPTRFTSNALSISVAESLSETGLYHSSAWFVKHQQRVDSQEVSRQQAMKEHEFARLLQTPVTVCTIDHLLMSLTLSREEHHAITFNLAHSCLVIDEADFYDDFTQENILVLLEILKHWDVPVLLMSASLPESIVSSYRKTGYEIDRIIADESDQERERFKIESIQEYTGLNDISDLLELCIEKGSAIIYVNTVDKAIAFYNWFVEKGVKPILYHSRYTEPDKLKKEGKLIKALGKEAWLAQNAKGIAIMTQIGEMSINISADIMISELCPIDRLMQRTGRLCRFSSSMVGVLYILLPQKNDTLYPAPYGQYDMKMKQWVPFPALEKTNAFIRSQSYNEKQLLEMLNKVYAENTEPSVEAIENAKTLKAHFRDNWLILPMDIRDKDDDRTSLWRSRNMVIQDTVFTEIPDSKYFRNYYEFNLWKTNYSLELPTYLIKKAFEKEHIIDPVPIRIGDEELNIFLIREGHYTEDVGAFNISDQYL